MKRCRPENIEFSSEQSQEKGRSVATTGENFFTPIFFIIIIVFFIVVIVGVAVLHIQLVVTYSVTRAIICEVNKAGMKKTEGIFVQGTENTRLVAISGF